MVHLDWLLVQEKIPMVLESEEEQKCPGLRFILKISAQGTCNRHPVSLVRRESPKADM
jgi:hypothetical protein